ncbi:MAG TPA: polysaccharide lyase, partial [Verrucomicrobiales bacterium]|nr:polysaccharide lyase [Verrucomicrobiales bacterium]
QYPNGAWPQQFREPPDSATHPIKRADYPATWSRTFPNQTYKGHYTFNDNAMVDMMNVLFEAQRIYGDDRYRRAAEKTGGVLLLAQMPEPQPGWAQQYNADMAPAWARKFEPASVGGGEAQSVMFALIQLYRMTGDKKYLEPIPRALAYYKRSQRPDGKLARFYELKTNKPLYFTKDYQLTYSDADMPTHYGFVVSSRLGKIEREYEDALKTPKDQLDPPRKKDDYKMSSDLMKRARAAIDIMDSRGAWVEMGKLRYHGSDDKTREIIDTRTVVKNILTLAQFISASKQPSP